MSASAANPLLSPLRLRGRTLPNRIVFGAHPTNFRGDAGSPGNGFGARHLAYYLERARGGVGLLVTETMTVHPLDQPAEHVPAAHGEALAPSLAGLVDALKEAAPDITVVAGLGHSGGQSTGKQLRQSPWAPSGAQEVASKRMARAINPSQIEEVVDGFARAAERVRRCGADGVELNAGQQSLLRQFLSPLTNQRSDGYGGPLENRARLLLRTAAVVRQALGAGPVLGIKLCGDELAPWGGLTVEDAVAIAGLLVEGGGVDYLSIQIGGPYSAHMTEAGMPVEPGHGAHLAARVREGFQAALPVFAEGRIESIALAAALIDGGQADAVVMTRALLSDPELPRKAAGANAEPVRPHVGMMRYFSVQGDWNRPVSDLANPRAGREASLPPPAQTAAPRRLLVIGGGVAGMETALTLARAGHKVMLREALPALGGMAARLAGQVAARAEFAPLIGYYEAMLARLGVRVEAGRAVEGQEAELENFAAVFLATGALGAPNGFQAGKGTVLSPRELLHADPERLPRRHRAAAVVDRELGFRMAAAVEWLLAHQYAVDVITPDFLVGRELVESAEFLWFNRVAGQGARFHPRLEAHSYKGERLACVDRFSHQKLDFGPLDLVVAAVAEVPNDALRGTLNERRLRVIPVGDCIAPRLMGEAIAQAHRAALEFLAAP